MKYALVRCAVPGALRCRRGYGGVKCGRPAIFFLRWAMRDRRGRPTFAHRPLCQECGVAEAKGRGIEVPNG